GRPLTHAAPHPYRALSRSAILVSRRHCRVANDDVEVRILYSGERACTANSVPSLEVTRTVSRSFRPHGGMSCLDDPHRELTSWEDGPLNGPLGSGSPSFFASDLVAAHRPPPFALLAPLPMCSHARDSRAALASSSARELMERCEAERHDTWQQSATQQRRWNAAAAQPSHSALLPMRAPGGSAAWDPASAAAAAAALTHSQPLLAAAAAPAAALWSGNERADSDAHGAAIHPTRSSLNGLCSPSHFVRGSGGVSRAQRSLAFSSWWRCCGARHWRCRRGSEQGCCCCC
ncbi:unnamed protein product, partial [Closterium sp. NIES-54]